MARSAGLSGASSGCFRRNASRCSFPAGRRMLVATRFTRRGTKSGAFSFAFITRASAAIWTARSSMSMP